MWATKVRFAPLSFPVGAAQHHEEGKSADREIGRSLCDPGAHFQAATRALRDCVRVSVRGEGAGATRSWRRSRASISVRNLPCEARRCAYFPHSSAPSGQRRVIAERNSGTGTVPAGGTQHQSLGSDSSVRGNITRALLVCSLLSRRKEKRKEQLTGKHNTPRRPLRSGR